MIGLVMALVLAELPPQRVEKGACAMVLWERGSRRRIAFWPAAGALTLGLESGPVRLAPVPGSGSGAPVLGLLPKAGFGGEGLAAVIEVEVTTSEATPRSAAVPDGVLRLTGPGGEEMLVPVAGVIGCA
jgi:hypothetical protein